MKDPDWIVSKFGLTENAMRYGMGVSYPWRVEGLHVDSNASFYWTVPALLAGRDGYRYDLTNAVREGATVDKPHAFSPAEIDKIQLETTRS